MSVDQRPASAPVQPDPATRPNPSAPDVPDLPAAVDDWVRATLTTLSHLVGT